MRLTDLDPRWLVKDGARVAFVFRCPVRGHKGHWVSCFFAPTVLDEQDALIDAELGENALCARCNVSAGWSANPHQASADFATLSITPSIDGGSLPYAWHGHIVNGDIVGGLPPPQERGQ